MMKLIPFSQLKEGEIASNDFYSEKGELLISKGVVINKNHLNMLERRNIFELYVKPSSEEEIITSLINKEFDKLEKIDIEEPAQKEIPEFNKIKKGKDGLIQLLSSKKAHELDKKLGITPDRPIGPALKNKATEMTVSQRTPHYKNNIATAYDGALKEVKFILDTLARGGNIDGKQVKNIVEKFVNIFITDRNILLNISGIKHKNEDYIYHHSLNVCLLTINIAASAGYNENQVIEIGMGALLHDIGMLLIPKEIRTKQSRLAKEEWYEIQKHPILGLHLLEKVSKMPETVPYVAYQIHERENSTGYPKKRNSLLIHRFAKLSQVADVYEAMTSPRSYRKPYIPHEGIIRIIKMSKAGLIPGEYVKAFLEYSSVYPVGSLVELSDHTIAKVIQANKNSLSKPVVSVVTNSKGKILNKSSIFQIDLSKNTNLQVIKALPYDYLNDIDIMDGF